ncbi:MAG: hypothetical protein WCJ84_01845 [Candidatus Peregrinibacteria bacterium]
MHFFRLFLDFFFPPDCVVCGEEGNILCASCVQKIDGQHFYAFSSESLENIFVLGEYEDPVLEKAIHALKYHFSEDMGIHLLPFLRAQLSRVSLPSSAILVPIPLHFFRLHERGFNQSEILANIFSKILFPDHHKKVQNLLKRVRNTPHQAHLSPQERMKNMEKAFALKKNTLPKDTPLVLVDDVASTLATLHEAAEVLKENGFLNISAIVLARSQQSRDKKTLAEQEKKQ